MLTAWKETWKQNGFSDASAFDGITKSVKNLEMILKETFICVHNVKIHKASYDNPKFV
jgi:hypothetical protein